MDIGKVNTNLYKVFDKINSKYFTKTYPCSFSAEECWSEEFNVFQDREVFVHVGLGPFCRHYSTPENATNALVGFLKYKLSPISLISQSFTPSFRRTGIYSVDHSRAEIGLFAEHFRILSKYRTNDPIHGVSYITKRKDKFTGIDYSDTFGSSGFYASLYDRDVVIANILTGRFVSTYLHFLEEKFQVPYKKNKAIFSGVVYSDCNVNPVIQKNHSELYPVEFNRSKIYNLLLNKGAIVEKLVNGRVVVSMVSVRLMDEFIGNELVRDPYFLVSF